MKRLQEAALAAAILFAGFGAIVLAFLLPVLCVALGDHLAGTAGGVVGGVVGIYGFFVTAFYVTNRA